MGYITEKEIIKSVKRLSKFHYLNDNISFQLKFEAVFYSSMDAVIELSHSNELVKEVYNNYLIIRERDLADNFTLRNSEHLKVFESFLDKMLVLLDKNPVEFVNLFPKCPMMFWEKIDDLREISYKRERDSEEYTRCLEKCKKLSFSYSNLTKNN